MSRIILVRHGEAIEPSAWGGAGSERPLTFYGRTQARALVDSIGDRPSAIYCSPARRCQETMEPLAAAANVAIAVMPLLFEGEDPETALDVCTDLASDSDLIVVCTHGDVIAGMLRHCGAAVDAPVMPPTAGMWEIDVEAGCVVAARRPAAL